MQAAVIVLRIPANGTVEHDHRSYSVLDHNMHYTEIAVERLARPKAGPRRRATNIAKESQEE